MRLVNISGTWMCSEVYQRIESAQKGKKKTILVEN
jgi:hypothetical protein